MLSHRLLYTSFVDLSLSWLLLVHCVRATFIHSSTRVINGLATVVLAAAKPRCTRTEAEHMHTHTGGRLRDSHGGVIPSEVSFSPMRSRGLSTMSPEAKIPPQHRSWLTDEHDRLAGTEKGTHCGMSLVARRVNARGKLSRSSPRQEYGSRPT